MKFKKLIRRAGAILMASVFAMGGLSMSGKITRAAPASDIPASMLNNDALDALAYIGYKVQAQKNDGTIFKKYAGSATAYGSGISYGESGAANGLETNSSGKPDIAYFKSHGMQCGSYVSYFYFNYLPNVLGSDMSRYTRPEWPMSPGSWYETCLNWVNKGLATQVAYSGNGSTFTPKGKIVPGDIVIFKNADTDSVWTDAHVALYAGYYNGKHFLTHVGNSRGPEIVTVESVCNDGEKYGVNQKVGYVFHLTEFNPYGYIEVNKKSTDGTKLAGAVFIATNSVTKQAFTIGPTDSTGYAKSKELPYGTYTVRETKFPAGYVAYGATSWTVTVDDTNKGICTINAVNQKNEGTCRIKKTSEDGVVSGISFKITGNGVNKTVKTGAAGTVDVKLTPGTYTVAEVTSDKYVPQAAKTVTVKLGETATVNFKNVLKKFSIKVTKADKGTGKTLKGAVYGLYLNGRLVEELTTGENGSAVSGKHPCSTGYTIKEIKAPEGYLVDPKAYPVESAEPDNFSLEINSISSNVADDPQKGKIIIHKTGEQLTSISKHKNGCVFNYEEANLSGATFDVFAAEDIVTGDGTLRLHKGDKADTITTGENGIGESKELFLGEYLLVETQTPYGYIQNNPETRVRLSYAGQDITVTSEDVYINNDRQKATISIKKTLEEDRFHLLNEDIKNVTFGLYSKYDIVAANGDICKADELIEIAAATDDGTIHFRSDIPIGGFYLKELSTCSGYVLDENLYEFNFDYEVDKDVCDIRMKILNKPEYGCVKGIKTDVNNNPLADAVIALYDDTGIFLEKCKTGKDGRFEFRNLPIGRYRVRELSAPDGYAINVNAYKADISGTGDIEYIHIVNQKSELVETGDDNTYIVLIVVVILSFLAVAGMILLKIKKRGDA